MLIKFILFILKINYCLSYSNYLNLFLTNRELNKYINKGFLPRGFELYKENSKYLLEGPLNNKQIDKFYNEGYIIIENLISDELLYSIKKKKFKNEYNLKEYGSIIFNPLNNDFDFKKVVYEIGKAVAQLTPQVNNNDNELYVINNKLLKFNGGINGKSKGFNWHINKVPICENTLGPGINAYLALDNVDENGGGICLAIKSHTHKYINYRNNINNNIIKDLDKIIYAPILNEGDVILSTRYLFKRTSEFNNPNAKKNIRRYIINYMPSSAIVNDINYKNKTIKELSKNNKYNQKFIKIPLIKKYSYKYKYDYL